MYKFIQKNQKKFLAIFAVGLMIVFILPNVAFDKRHGTPQEVIAELGGDDKIRLGEVRDAHEQWQNVSRYLIEPTVYLTNDFRTQPEIWLVLQRYASDIEKNPVYWLLLQREAQRMGLRVAESDVDGILGILYQQAKRTRQPLPEPALLKPALRSLLVVRALFQRVADSIKPSDPLILHEMATRAQQVKLNLVHYSTDDFKKCVAAPTPEEIQKQFDQFKSLPPAHPTAQNPFGFGYLVPSKVQLRYLTVSRKEVARAVRASKSEFDWEVAARMHYRAHLSQYQTTESDEDASQQSQPATTQTTQSAASRPASTRSASTRPTTRPFAEVKEDIIKELTDPQINARLDEIVAALSERLTTEYDAHQKNSAQAPTDFGTRQHIERVAADIEKRFGVKLGVSEINDPKDEQGLRELAGIGQSAAGELSFPQYVLRQAEPLLSTTQRSGNADVLSLDEPSRVLRDGEGNAYIFQILDAKPAHAPADAAAVKDKLEADIRTRHAFDAVVAAARKLQQAASAASASEAGGLESAAKAAGKDVFTTPQFFDRNGATEAGPADLIPAVELPPDARDKLVGHAFELLARATPDKPHPTGLVELPTAGRVVVGELAEVQRPWRDDDQMLVAHQFGRGIASPRAQRVLTDYFKPAAVKRRLEYHSRTDEPDEVAAAN